MAVFETVGPGSIPGRVTRLRKEATVKNVLGVCRKARDSAKVEDQVRFLARALFTELPFKMEKTNAIRTRTRRKPLLSSR